MRPTSTTEGPDDSVRPDSADARKAQPEGLARPKPFAPVLRPPTWLRASDLQGLAQLATQGTLGATHVAEAVHGSVYKIIAKPFGPVGARFVDQSPGSTGIRPRGITSYVYGGVRGITRLAGGTVNSVLSRLALKSSDESSRSPPAREAMIAAINGVLGDHLVETANPLALTMSLRSDGDTLPLSPAGLAARLPQAGGKILVLVHGLCMNDLQWSRVGADGGAPRDHGLMLAREGGYTPVYLRYNTGLHTSTNGSQLAGLLEALSQAWPVPVSEITLIGHSMGGLVVRSASHYGEVAGHSWRRQLKNLVFLGTPHHGAPLETLGSWVDTLLRAGAVTRPFARIGQLRSAGITDLRHGNLLTEDWVDADRFERAPDVRRPVPLPMDVRCFTMAAALGEKPVDEPAAMRLQMASQLLGDGLVPLPSALGQHADETRHLAFADSHQYVVWKTGHIAMLASPEVASVIRNWLAAAA